MMYQYNFPKFFFFSKNLKNDKASLQLFLKWMIIYFQSIRYLKNEDVNIL